MTDDAPVAGWIDDEVVRRALIQIRHGDQVWSPDPGRALTPAEKTVLVALALRAGVGNDRVRRYLRMSWERYAYVRALLDVADDRKEPRDRTAAA